MQNFFEKNNDIEYQNSSSNPFSKQVKNDTAVRPKENGKRLNIIDMEVLNSNSKISETEFMEIRMNNLNQIIHQNPQNLDPVSLEKLKIEWESLRDSIYQQKNAKKTSKKQKNNGIVFMFKEFGQNFSKMITLFKINSPKIKSIMNTFNEINKEVEDLVKKATPVGEEEIKYGLLVNKIYQASKLNGALSNEIK